MFKKLISAEGLHTPSGMETGLMQFEYKERPGSPGTMKI